MIRQTVTENGAVRGLPGTDPRVTSFKGIPFAAPPVGANRWRAPQKAADWDGVLDAFTYGPISVQDTPGLGDDLYCREWHVDPEIPMGEDCLYLNVWTGAKKTDDRLPVLVWFFGGGFQWGYTAEMEFDGEQIARRGVIVVSVNYRLGALGFLTHPEISKESPDAPGNFGNLDQQAGLKWVRRNIANFGGDPDNITIAGQSAGGSSVLTQMTCEDNFDDIKNAVIMSGLIRNPFITDPIIIPRDIKDTEKIGEKFFEFLGVKTLEEARALDAIYIRDKYAQFRVENGFMATVIDHNIVKDDPYKLFLEGKYAPINVISGNTLDEFLAKAPSKDTDDVFEKGDVQIVEASVKAVFNRNTANPSKGSMYYYRFMPDIPGSDNPGCFHSCDLWYWFNTISKCSRPYKGRHYELAMNMCDYFTNFIKTGNPNGCGFDGVTLPEWKNYRYNDRNEMNFTSDGPKAGIGNERDIDKAAELIGSTLQGFNPYLPSWEYIPDGEPYVFDDRVYVYGSHDYFNGATFCPGDYVCYSAPVDDLRSWRYEGVIYESTQEPENPKRLGCLYAPDVTKGPDGRYYLFYVLDRMDIVSVAVCDTPAGKYKFLGYVHYPDGTLYGRKPGDEPQFDPGVLTEGDYTYLYTGFCGQTDSSRHGAMYVKLDKDMLTIVDGMKFIAPGKMHSQGSEYEGHAFFEAPSIRKRNDTYYFVYSSEVMHELCYATSKYPDRDFKYGGVIISNCDIGIDSYKPAKKRTCYGANNHGSIIEINNEWYIFYHRHTNGNWFSRQGCLEKIEFLPDGSIKQAEITSCGPNNAPLNDTAEYPAYIVCNIFGDDDDIYVNPKAPCVTQDGADGDRNIGYIKNISDGYTLGFKYFDLKDVTGMYIRTQGYGHGYFEIRTELDGPVLGKININSANIDEYFEGSMEKTSGVSAIYLTFRDDGVIRLKSFGFLH